MGAACILYNALVVGEEVEILLYCVIVGEGVVESVLYNAFCSDSASIFQQFMRMTAPKRRATSDSPHPHAAHLPYLPEPRQ